MAQASSFLRRKADERRKILDKQNGASQGGGSATQASANTRSSLDIPLGGGKDGAPATRASDFLRKRAEERAASIDKQYGADAYGGTNWREPDKIAGFNSWLSEVAGLSDQLNSDYAARQGKYQSGADFGRYRDENAAAIDRLINRANTYGTYFKDNAAMFDEETLANAQEALTQYGEWLSSARGNLDSEYDYWAQFEDEAAYTGFLDQQERNAMLSTFDVEGGRTTLSEKQAQLDAAKKAQNTASTVLSGLQRYGTSEQREWARASLAEATEAYHALLADVASLEKDIYDAENLQKGLSYNSLLGAADFGQYSSQGASVENPTMKEAEGAAYIFGWRPGAKDVGNIVTYSRDNWEQIALGEADNNRMVGRSLYHYMTDEEVSIYNYLLAKDGADKAQEYLDYLEETLNYRFGTGVGENIRGIENGFGRTLATGLYGFGAGLDQWASGARQLFSEERLPTTATQYGSAYIREDLAQSGPEIAGGSLGQMAYDATTVVGNMAPSILVSALTAGAGAPATAAKIAGAVTIGGSSAGNAYNQKRAEGYSAEKAGTYATLVGASEAGLQYLLGGITAMGGVTDDILLAKVAGIDNALARVALTGAVKIGSEITEEELQLWLEPAFDSLIFGTEYNAPTFEDMAYTAIVTALSTGLLESGEIASAGVTPPAPSTNVTTQAPATVEPAAPVAPTAPTAPVEPAVPVDGMTNDDIAAELVNAGATEAEAQTLAPILAAVLTGEEISGNQAGAIAKNEAAVSILESATGEEINTDAPLGEVKTTIRGLASRQSAHVEQTAAEDTPAQAQPVEAEEMAAAPAPVRTPPVAITGKENVQEFAATLGKAGEKVFVDMYDEEQNAVGYIDAMMKAYNAGKNGGTLDGVSSRLVTAPQLQAAYIAGQADANSAQNVGQTVQQNVAQTEQRSYTADNPGLSDLSMQFSIRDVATVNGIKYTLRQTGDGQYFLNIDRDTAVMGGHISDARAHIYDAGPFATRGEAVQEALDVALNNKLTEQEDTDYGTETVDEVPDGGAVRTTWAGRQDAGRLLDGVSSEDVRQDAQRWDVDPDAGAESGGTSGLARGYAAPGNDGVRSSGVHQGGSVRTAPGGLTTAEEEALLAYKSGGSYLLNAKLREGVELSELEQQIVDGLDTALPKLPAYKGTLYRNIGFDRFGDQEARDAFVAQHSEGALVGYPAYTSTSTSIDGYPVEGKFVVHMVIEGETGRDLAGYGNNSESEVLFERRKKFEVTKLTYDESGTPTIYMTEVITNEESDQRGESGPGSPGGRVPRGAGERDTPGGNQPEVQPVREAGTGSEVQRASERDTRRDPVQDAGVREVPAEVTTQEQIAEKADLGNQEQPKGSNYVIGEKGMKLPTTPKARYKANADAIKTLRAIMAEGRLATAEEQEILAKYTGWGGLTDVFDEKKTDWAKEYKQLKKLLDEGEYKTAKGSILDAYYTEPTIIQAMYNGLAKLGFTGGRLLEPSAGVGRFMGAMPAEMLGGVKSWTAVELDKITGNIAKYLYPNADVRVQGFETAKIPDNYMDVVIGNVPFGNFGVADKAYPAAITKSIHNYFIAKSLDKARPGGIVAVITSRETLDATGEAARSYFMKQADLIGAIRLPNTAFQGTGTNVTSDILVFKKREPGTAYKGEDFLISEAHYLNNGSWSSGDPYAAANEYFDAHPEMVLGKAKNTGSRYGQTLTYEPLETKVSLQKQIEKAFGRITAKMDYTVQPTQEEIRAEIKADAGKGKQGTLVNKGGKLYKNDGGQLVEAKTIKQADVQRMTDVLGIRDAARTLLDLQMDDGGAPAISKARKQLNTLYDAFVKKHGYLNSPKNKKLVQEDADSPFVLALEDYNRDTGEAAKAAIFTKNTVKPIVTVTHADTVEEALTVSMNETGTVDVGRIAQLTGQQVEDVRREMLERGLAFKNRNGGLEAAELYLAGNVRAKLRDAEALAEGDADYQRNVEALRKVIPADIPADEIKVRLGATWVPDNVYSAFAGEMLGGAGMTWVGGQRVPAIEVKYNRPVGKFFIDINDTWLRNRPENTSTWGTTDYPFVGGRASILDAALNNKTVSVWRSVGDKRVLDKQATAAAQEKLEKVLAEFQRWIWNDETRRADLGGLYNDVFNNTVTPKYDGSHLTVNGSNPDMEMRPHQKNAVQRIINSGGNTLLAHRVGAGKTYEMAAAAMKLRQLGIVKKPLFTVPKHLVAQWGNEFLSYFPAAKILVLEHKDFTPANRKLFANRIATGDYDAVIMSYEQFGMVPMSQANQEAFYQEQIDALEMAILESKRASGKKDPSIRDMERSKKSFEAKLKKLGDGKKDVDNIDFEQLGVDALFVDEAHNFKNLFYTTKMQGVADLGDKEGSQRAFDLYMKVRYLQRLNGGRGIVFATATPVMNSVVELYTMQRYLQGDLLDAKGLTNFDAWANQFGDVVTIRKMKTGGNGYELKQSLSKYKNLAEMQQMFRGFADVIVDAADLPYLKIPKMKTGKRIVVECDPSPFQEQFMEELGKRAEALRGAGKGGNEDHIFKVFDDGKKISYTQRMVDGTLPYEDGGKILKCVENVYRIWNDTKADKGTQLIFCDRGTPGGAEAGRGVSLYEDIKNLLVGQGVPANEIAFIHDASTDEAKAKLFKDVNDGAVRVLIGSTSKMGTGMNAQKRIAALHELNAPDRPGDLEQNEGRGLRQGNINDEVAVYAYVTKKTFDSRQWDNLKRKATFIHQIMAGEYNGREAEGDGDLALSAAEISAIASDNPLIMEQFEVSEKIANLENLERAHTKEVAQAKQRIVKAQQEIASDEEYLGRFKTDLASRQDTAGDKFRIILGGKTYTERKAAGEALVALAQKALNVSDPTESNTKVGSFAGFDLYVTSKGDMLLRGKAQYRGTVNMQSAAGTITALENIPRRLEGMISATETRLSENRASLSKLEQTINTPFARAEELIAARVREAEILAELNPPSEQALAAAEDEGDVESMVDYDVTNDAAPHPERWEAKRVGSTDKAPMRLSEIVEKIRHDFGLNITSGHVRGAGVRGQYNHLNKGIRSKITNDLPTISHELGHALNHRYDLLGKSLSAEMKTELENALGEMKDGYSKKQWYSEGLAEYVRKFLQNRETAAIDYPVFTEYFLNSISAKDAALIEQLADEINAYYSLDADTATSSIRLREEGAADARTVGEKIKAKASVLYQAWLDSNQGIKEYDKATGSNTYKLATNSAYSDAIAGQIVVGDLTDANGQYVAPGLKAALHGLSLNNKQEYRLFGEYLLVKHGPERLAEGMRIFADDRKNSTAFMKRRQAELEQQYPQFVEISKRLYDFQKQFLQTWGVGTGLVSPTSADEWGKRWEFYVPLNRAVSEDKRGIGAKRGFANQNSTIKQARGSGLDVVHPVDNIINNVVKMVNAGVRNNVMRSITDTAEALGADAAFLEKVPTPMVKRGFDMTGVKAQLTDWFDESDMQTADKFKAAGIVSNLDDILYQYGRGKAHGDVITVLKNGDQEFWKINDPLLLSSVTNMAPKKMEGILDAYAVVSRFMTANITGNNIIWSIFSNFPRDMGTFFTYSKVRNPAKVFASMGSAYVNKVKGDNADPLYKEYLAMGGGKTSAYTADRDLAKKARKALSDKKFNANPLDWIGFVSDTVELGPRFATYKLMRQAGMGPQEAFYEAMDITVNFRRGGELSRQVNKVVPFFNASVQGLDKFRRWITAADAPAETRAKVVRSRTITYIAVSAALAALFYGLNNRDDEAEEDYEQLSNYTKNSFWNIPLGDGKYFSIPKPRDLGVLTSFFETCMEYGIGENKHAFDEFYSYAAENWLPSVVSDVAQADIAGAIGSLGIVGVGSYMVANRDFLGRPIVSSGLQNLEPKDQYNDRTSKIAYWVGQAFNTSPQMVDYFFGSVLGGWWKSQKALFPVGKENVDFTLGVQNSYIKDNQYSTDLVNWLYDKSEASQQAKNSDSGNMEKAITYKMDSNMTTFYSRYYKLAKNTAETTATRATRQTVLNMILEYQKAADSGKLTAAQRAVYAVCERQGNTENLPSVMQSTIKDGKEIPHTLSDVQYVEYQTDYLRLYWNYVEANLNTRDTPAQQAAVLKAAKDVAKEEATNRTLARIGAAQTGYFAEFEGVSNNTVISYKAQRDLANDDGSLKQEEVIGILKMMIANEKLSYEEAYILFHSEYDSDKNNPWKKYKP